MNEERMKIHAYKEKMRKFKKKSIAKALSERESEIWHLLWNKTRAMESRVAHSCNLSNLGNSCYISSVLQCLSHARRMFRVSFEKSDISILLSKMTHFRHSRNTIHDLYNIFVTQSRRDLQSGLRQMDANEFFLYILNKYDFLYNMFDMKMILTTVDEQGNRIGERQVQQAAQYQIFHSGETNICLKKYLMANRVRVDMTEDDTKQVTIYNVSDNTILCFHIQRFSVQNRNVVKQTFVVRLPMEFDANIITSTCCHVYDLIGVVIHTGDLLENGHFFSIVRHAGNWWKYDDMEQDPVMMSAKDVAVCEAYMVFYVRREDEK